MMKNESMGAETLFLAPESNSADTPAEQPASLTANGETDRTLLASYTAHTAALQTYSWCHGTMSEAATHTVGLTENAACPLPDANRMYVTLAMPALPRNPRIKRAELTLYGHAATLPPDGTSPKIALYALDGAITPGSCTPAEIPDPLDYAAMAGGEAPIRYTFDVSATVEMLLRGEATVPGLVLRLMDETPETPGPCMTLYGGESEGLAPCLTVIYESDYATSTAYRTHTHPIGPLGCGSVDLLCGSLMLELEGLALGGNRMPVTVKHLFHSALSDRAYTADEEIGLYAADFSAMRLGHGFRLNLMQSIVHVDHPPVEWTEAELAEPDRLWDGYIHIGEDGERTYLKESRLCRRDENGQCYRLYVAVEDGDVCYDPVARTLALGNETHLFDAAGRLIRTTDVADNSMDVTYRDGRLTAVTDGAGRTFSLAYTEDGYLATLTAPDATAVRYTYSDGHLTGIAYPEGRSIALGYTADKPAWVALCEGQAVVYRVAYTFTGDRLTGIAEYGKGDAPGASSTYAYSAASRTVVTTTEPPEEEGEEDHVLTTTYTFDGDGNVIGEYTYSTATGNLGSESEGSGIHPHAGDGGVNPVSRSENLLYGHGFEKATDLDYWPPVHGSGVAPNVYRFTSESSARFGKSVLRMTSHDASCRDGGVGQTVSTLPAGEYTFSAYLRVISPFIGDGMGACLRVTDENGALLGISERIGAYDGEYVRLAVPFTLAASGAVQVALILSGRGTVDADGVQLEAGGVANAYNLLENGGFELVPGWSYTAGASAVLGHSFRGRYALAIVGDTDTARYAKQSVAVRTARATRETFTLSGWAKGWGLPIHERVGITEDPLFRLRAALRYADGETEEFTADFSPATEEWQPASVQLVKSKCKQLAGIDVYCDYGYNSGIAYFDDLQLVRNSLELQLSDADFEGQRSEEEAEPDSGEEATSENTETASVFEEATDSFGNTLTETTFQDGEFGSLYRAFGYSANGNDLVSETDARGHKTTYTVDGNTSRNEEVTDRLGNKTAYEYDNSGRTTKVTSKIYEVETEENKNPTVSYAYDAFDNMTEIVRGDGMKYALAYNEFHNLESIGIEGKDEALIRYTYKNGNGRLKQMTYANGHTMKAVYNAIGQMVAERWFETEAQATDSTATPMAHYKYVYDGDGNIVRSLDMTAGKEYNYEYEEGRIVRATEADIELNSEIVTSKVIVNTVKYYYDTEGKMTKKVITPASGSAQTIYYETNDNNTVVKFSAGGRTVTSHSRTDSFGRKVFDELQLGTDFVSRQFVYHAGKVTDTHKEKAKVKSSATTQLVSQIILSGGTTLSYGYDAEERITSVVETYTVDETPVTNTTIYTYDALGQLLTETVNGEVVNTMKYDNYGNIVEKNGKAYTYGDTTWKDLLTGFDGKAIEYDAQGNPVKYLGHTLTWEKGRQLKKFDNIEYTYNANGIRTSKTVGGVKHTYTLDGTKILRETWDGNTLIPLYDNEDSVCGILYNNVPYYFIKNLQGDVIALVDKDAQTVARYSYDAWGQCLSILDSNGKKITNTSHAACINPFRYRGYYFDEEIGLYYLQSRYYDASVGRFINTDVPEYCLLALNATGHNLLVYCINNPVNLSDSNGNIALVDDAAVWAFIGLCAVLMLLLAWMSTPQFQRAWIDFCTAVGNGLSWIATGIVNGGKAAWNWTRKQVKAATAAITTFITIARADSKIKSKIRKTSKDRYWTATLRTNYVDIGRAISYSKAVKEVSNGRNVFTVTSSEAKAVAKAAYSNKKPVGPEIDKGKENTMGYYYHYHVYQRKKKGHVFFLFW